MRSSTAVMRHCSTWIGQIQAHQRYAGARHRRQALADRGAAIVGLRAQLRHGEPARGATNSSYLLADIVHVKDAVQCAEKLSQRLGSAIPNRRT